MSYNLLRPYSLRMIVIVFSIALSSVSNASNDRVLSIDAQSMQDDVNIAHKIDSVGIDESVIKATDKYLETRFLNGIFVFSDDQSVITKGARGKYSIARSELEVNRDLKFSDQMFIASITKGFTAAAIMKLRDKNLLNLDDTIAMHLKPDSKIWKDDLLPDWASRITIHDLLAHRSGLQEYLMQLDLDVAKPHAKVIRDIAQFAASHTLKFTPGAQYEYINTNYIMLGLIIEQVSGSSLSEFYTEELFRPLEMNNTRLLSMIELLQYQKSPAGSNLPVLYFVIPTGAEPKFVQARSRFKAIPFADGGCVSTAQDLLTWQKALHNGKVVSKDSYQLMTSKHGEAGNYAGMKNYTGYGLYISEMSNGDIMYHNSGRALAITSESGYLPTKNLYFTIMSNTTLYIPKEIQDKIDMKKVENQLDIRHFLKFILQSVI